MAAGSRANCYTGLAISSLVVVMSIASTHYACSQRHGQEAQLACVVPVNGYPFDYYKLTRHAVTLLTHRYLCACLLSQDT